MIRFLIDTNVISELRKIRPHGAVTSWLDQQTFSSIALSVMTITEIQQGILLTRKQDTPRAEELEAWLSWVGKQFNILSVDTEIAREWARLRHGKTQQLFDDALIAATARVHRLTVATRNIKDFDQFDVPTLNPFEPS